MFLVESVLLGKILRVGLAREGSCVGGRSFADHHNRINVGLKLAVHLTPGRFPGKRICIKVGDDVVILDMGVQLDNYIKVQDEREGASLMNARALIKNNAIPNDKVIEKWKDKVKLIICTHAHLDHIGALPYLAEKYDCPIMGTPYTIEVLKTICRENKQDLKNLLKPLNKNSKHKISDNLTVEFISVTHSTPQTVLLALHTKEGTILYANDYKFDMFPVLEKKTNFNRLKELENVRVLIVESLYANEAMKMPSESVAKAMLKDVILGTASEGRAIIISTFSSHLSRLSSIIKYSKELNRKIMFVGRSLAKYGPSGTDSSRGYNLRSLITSPR